MNSKFYDKEKYSQISVMLHERQVFVFVFFFFFGGEAEKSLFLVRGQQNHQNMHTYYIWHLV